MARPARPAASWSSTSACAAPSGRPALLLAGALALALTASGCGSGGGALTSTYVCSPACPAGTHCDQSGCVADDTSDMRATPDLTAAVGCSPACGGATPFCNPQNQCVACLTDDQCPDGQLCKAIGATTACVTGCGDDARCAGLGAGYLCCGGQCTNGGTDVANCGGCGTTCGAQNASPTCTDGKCGVGACSSGYADCNHDTIDGCETNVLLDPVNCGACGTTCKLANATAGCATNCYIRACNFGFDNCNGKEEDGCEANVLADPKNCGACANPCPKPPHAAATCLNAACALTMCDVGYGDCNGDPKDGCEVSIFTDAKNCGACGAACAQGLVCRNGGCTCPQCNFPNASSKCLNNVCIIDKCVDGFADCNNDPKDGCEVAVGTDIKNCGACGNICPQNLKSCSGGVCIAALEFGPAHTWTGLTSTHYITQGGCSAGGGNIDTDAAYFCTHFYSQPLGMNCTPVKGYVAGKTPNCGDAKMHKRNGCTGNGNDIPNTMCDGGACKIGNWNECTSGVTNLICHCE